jgi:hypothetical protein
MLGKARIDVPGALHHLIVRGRHRGHTVVKYRHLIAIMGMVNRPWQDTASVLGFFGQNTSRYRRFVEKGISGGKTAGPHGGGLGRH